jgi:hypothetical protein
MRIRELFPGHDAEAPVTFCCVVVRCIVVYCSGVQRVCVCVVFCVLCFVFCVLCIVYCVLCIVYCVLCIVYCVSCIVLFC